MHLGDVLVGDVRRRGDAPPSLPPEDAGLARRDAVDEDLVNAGLPVLLDHRGRVDALVHLGGDLLARSAEERLQHLLEEDRGRVLLEVDVGVTVDDHLNLLGGTCRSPRCRLRARKRREDVPREELELFRLGGHGVQDEVLDPDTDSLLNASLILIDGSGQEDRFDVVPGASVGDDPADRALLLGNHVRAAAALDDVAEVLVRDSEAALGPDRACCRGQSLSMSAKPLELLGRRRMRDPAIAGADPAEDCRSHHRPFWRR